MSNQCTLLTRAIYLEEPDATEERVCRSGVGDRRPRPAAAAAAGQIRTRRRKLNAGNHSTLLAAYADDAVLRFNNGDHRWAGDWVGKPAIGRFLENFTAAKVQGEIKQIAVGGHPGR